MKLLALLADFLREWRELLVRQARRVGWIAANQIKEEVTVRTRHGRLTFPTRDKNISAGLYLSRQYEYDDAIRAITLIKATCLKSVPLVLYDVGANIGFIGIGLVNTGLVDYVVAFEPEPRNYGYLVKNIQQNDLASKVFPVHAALTEEDKELQFEISAENHGDHRVRTVRSLINAEQGEDDRAVVAVRGLALDHMPWADFKVPDVAKVPSILWMDVQGFEGHVFKGAQGLLAQGIPSVIEVSPYCIQRSGMSLTEFKELLSTYWKTFYVDRRGRMITYPISRLDDLLAELSQNATDYTNIILVP